MARKILGTLILALVILARPAVVEACTNANPFNSNMSIQITSATTARVRVLGYSTFGTVGAGGKCGCGLAANTSSAITGVTGAQLVDAGTLTNVTNFGSFTSNANVASALQTASPAPGSTTWVGFQTTTTGSVAGSQPADLLFDLSIVSGTTKSQVINALSTNLIGTGETDASGGTFISHFGTTTGIAITVPGIRPALLVALLIALVGSSVVLRRTWASWATA